MKDVRAIDFPAHLPEGDADKIDDAVKKLAHSDYREREKGVRPSCQLSVGRRSWTGNCQLATDT